MGSGVFFLSLGLCDANLFAINVQYINLHMETTKVDSSTDINDSTNGSWRGVDKI